MGDHEIQKPSASEMSEYLGIPESVSPEGLVARAEIVRAKDPSCARHLELAAEEIKRLRRQTNAKVVEPDQHATRFATNVNDRLKAATFTLFRKDDVLGFLIMDPEETYHIG